MAANRIRGITIEIGGDTTKLEKALAGVNKDLRATQTNLKDVNKLLKIDPKNVTLLTQKQDYLNKSIEDTKKKLGTAKDALEQLKRTNGVDNVTEEQKALEREIVETEQKLKSAQKELRQFGSVGVQQANAVAAKMKEVGGKVSEVGQGFTRNVTAPIVAAGTVGAAKFAEVDKTMTLTNATMKNTKAEADLLNSAMKTAAANSTFGMSDAATATLNFARAGLNAEQSAAALAPAMNLAAGEGGNLDTVSGGLVATINGFHGSFEDAGKYADVFANACNNSALDVNGLSSAMSVAAPIFSSAGYNVKDAALYMGVMANAGIDANVAANSLKTGLARLVSPSKSGAEMMAKLGISVTNADGSMKDSITIQKELHDKFKDLSESEQIAAASAIFGKNQMAPWLALINTAPEDVNNLNTALSAQGTTTQMANAQMSGFGGSIEKLKSSVDVAATSFGEALAPSILAVSNKIQGAVDWFNSLDASQQQLIAKIAIVAAAVGPILMLVGSVITGIGNTITAINIIRTTMAAVVPVISGVASAAAPFLIGGAIIVGIITAAALIIKNWDKIKAAMTALAAWISQKWTEIKTKVSTIVENLKTAVTSKIEAMKEGVKNKISSMKESAAQTVENLKTSVSEKFQAVKEKALGIFSDIKTGIQEKIQAAKEKVGDIIDDIKDFFDFDWSLPDLKLPHINVGAYIDVPVLGRIPDPSSISVDWYKKAYDNPIMFTRPTVLQTPSGNKGFGDGSGGEVVLSEAKLRQIAGSGAPITVNVYGSQGMNVNELAAAVERRLVAVQRQREAAGFA